MASKKEIEQYLKEMYAQKFTLEELEVKVHQLKRMGSQVYTALLELAESEDSGKKHFAFSLLSNLGNKKIIPILSKLAYESHKDDETKLLAAITIFRLGGLVDFEALENNLSDPQVLGEKIIETLLKDSDKPFFVKIFQYAD